MSDEFFEDDFEDMLFDPDNDFYDDLVGEEYNHDEEDDEGAEESHRQDIDFGDAFVFGTMIGGIARDEEAEERLRKKLIEENEKNKLVDKDKE